MNRENLIYCSIRLASFFLSLFPLKVLHKIGNKIGLIAYYFLRSYRKRTLSNLSLATNLHLTKKELIQTAKHSFQNLAITCLEYAKFEKMKNLHEILICENPEKANQIYASHKGIIFFCGHQANWEVLFLEGTRRMRGVAIARPLKNRFLYHWILRLRQRYGGEIIPPKETIKKGLRALKEGKFLGIVADQGMPESHYSFPFFGRKAFSNIAPALLSYKTHSPIIVATVKRIHGIYRIHYHDPIYPNLKNKREEEIKHLTAKALQTLEMSIRERPGEWLWQHNRWKQETPSHVYYRFRYDSILIILPLKPQKYLPHLKTFREIYPRAFITILCPQSFTKNILLNNVEILPYKDVSELFLRDYRFKLVFNFSEIKKIKKHYLKLSAFKVLSEKTLYPLTHLPLNSPFNLSLLLTQALCRKHQGQKENAL